MSWENHNSSPLQGTAVLRSPLGRTLAWFWLLLGLLLWLPSPARRVLRQAGSADTAERAVSSAPAVPGVPAQRVPVVHPSDPAPAKSRVAVSLEDPHQSMRWLYRSLARTAAKKPNAQTRVLHFGDSLLDLDMITGDMRRLWQDKFGDGGHGYALAGRPWRWYNQRKIRFAEQEGAWKHLRLVGGQAADGRLGLGCAALESGAGGGWVQVATQTERKFSVLDVHYLKKPGGGRLEVLVDGRPRSQVETAAPQPESGFVRLELPLGPHRVKLRARGRVRLLGLAMDRQQPGVTWENLPLISARFHQLNTLDLAHWTQQLQRRAPALVVFQFGANDTVDFGGDLPRYRAEVQGILEHVRDVLPRTSCLVVGPLDRLQRNAQKGLYSPPVVRRVSGAQRQAALAARCAFWDGQNAMGGPGAMTQWLAQGWAQKDLVHLNLPGSKAFAQLLDEALEAGFSRYWAQVERSPATPAPENSDHALQ